MVMMIMWPRNGIFVRTVGCGLMFLLALSLNGGEADALTCYVCNSNQNASCALSPPDEAFIQECKQEQNVNDIPYSVCRLMVVEREAHITVDRRCGWISYREKDSCINEPRIDIKAVNCECHSENCNAASSKYADTLMVLGCTATVAVLTAAIRRF